MFEVWIYLFILGINLCLQKRENLSKDTSKYRSKTERDTPIPHTQFTATRQPKSSVKEVKRFIGKTRALKGFSSLERVHVDCRFIPLYLRLNMFVTNINNQYRFRIEPAPWFIHSQYFQRLKCERYTWDIDISVMKHFSWGILCHEVTF